MNKYIQLFAKIAFYIMTTTMCSSAFALGLQLSTIKVTIDASQKSASLYLINSNLPSTINVPLNAQVRVYQWRQQNNEDVLVPTEDIIISPPMATIQPGQQQLIRIIRRPEVPADDDLLTYRLIINELPSGYVGSLPSSSALLQGVNFIAQYSVPLLVSQVDDRLIQAKLQPSFEWSDERVTLTLLNIGNGIAQIGKVLLRAPDGQEFVLNPGLLGYVLPNNQRTWSFPLTETINSQSQVIAIQINGQETTYPISKE